MLLPFLRDLTCPFPVPVSAPLAAAAVVWASASWAWACEWWSWPAPPVAMRSPLSMATNVMNPTRMASPRTKFLLGSTSTNLALSGSSSPKKISGSRWNSVSPSKPPTAKATMTLSDDGSMFVGHSASRKLGGPEMYSVARRALTAGDPGKRTAKRRVVRDEGAAA